ncbi:hypothetical protein P6166_10040 [Stenotrophomonas sp. HITSZ_GD]|uniref:hypothetical protein n=1 Tax=Stenotrophomonas sp. HITSZ_GD TaxID=3037248 RepID=UPI00240E6AC3|nr:hypothetical protein [Stenotrophomonas sp. HITSZ_GD]MDG2525694.1 hypothetical protein [Stenotrophomonas sp. HITSZ_GD]
MNDKHKQTQDEAFDDVDRLFARLGSKGADEYRDFVPGRLPAREAAAPATPAPAVETAEAVDVPAAAAVEPPALPVPPPSPPILASIRPLRAEAAASQVQVQPRPAGAPATELDALFQRLLQADAAPAAAGPLRRMFGR